MRTHSKKGRSYLHLTPEQSPPSGSRTTPAPAQVALPWERQRDESAPAFAALVAYRDLEEGHTLGRAAELVGKSRALLASWSRRHDWMERVFQWDQHRFREQESALQTARQQALQRQAQDSDRLQRLAMARLGQLVRRDAETGELELDPEVSVQDAVRIYRLGLEIGRALPAPVESEPGAEAGEDQLRRLTDAELHQLIALAKTRAESEDETDDGVRPEE